MTTTSTASASPWHVAAAVGMAAPAVLAQTPDRMTYLYPRSRTSFRPSRRSPFARPARLLSRPRALRSTWQTVGKRRRGRCDPAGQRSATQRHGRRHRRHADDRAGAGRPPGAKAWRCWAGRSLTQVDVRRASREHPVAGRAQRARTSACSPFQDTTFFNLLACAPCHQHDQRRCECASRRSVRPASMQLMIAGGSCTAICGVPEWAAGYRSGQRPA
jgi:hypothetical protein